MLVFLATEKDCQAPSASDGDVDRETSFGSEGAIQECVVCLEEFEPGVRLARLECLCKFHEHCILSWWRAKKERGGQGEDDETACPVHYQGM